MYKLGGGNRQQLMHSMITDPFTDEQLDWTLTEISKVRTKNSFISPNSTIKPSKISLHTINMGGEECKETYTAANLDYME